MNLHEQLIKIQSELKAPKGQENKFGHYMYRNCEDILEAVKPLLKKHNCSMVIRDEIILIGDRYYVQAEIEIEHEEKYLSVKAMAREATVKKGMDESQITGAASSYARKYALNGLFLIDDTKDADSQEPPKEVKKQARKPATPDFNSAINKLFANPSEALINKCEKWLEKNKAPVDVIDYFKKYETEFFIKREQMEKENEENEQQ